MTNEDRSRPKQQATSHTNLHPAPKQERAATRPPQAPNYFAAFPFGVTVNANAST